MRSSRALTVTFSMLVVVVGPACANEDVTSGTARAADRDAGALREYGECLTEEGVEVDEQVVEGDGSVSVTYEGDSRTVDRAVVACEELRPDPPA